MENQTEGDIVEAARFEEEPLTNLHPNHATVLRIQAVLFSLPFLVAALALEVRAPFWPGIIIGPVTILAFFAILRIPMRRHLARGYTMGNDRLRVVRGILFRHDAVVPFGRVQHIDVNQGPLERMFGISTLTLHTAGTHNASVHLPGLEEGLAREMREEIRAHIRRDTL
jgi:membrane protein YdbS with pleckstrin-like domain